MCNVYGIVHDVYKNAHLSYNKSDSDENEVAKHGKEETGEKAITSNEIIAGDNNLFHRAVIE